MEIMTSFNIYLIEHGSICRCIGQIEAESIDAVDWAIAKVKADNHDVVQMFARPEKLDDGYRPLKIEYKHGD